MAVLVVSHWKSECSNCPGSSVDPSEENHLTNYNGRGYLNAPCGERYTSIVSCYLNEEEIVKAMRPDLPYGSETT